MEEIKGPFPQFTIPSSTAPITPRNGLAPIIKIIIGVITIGVVGTGTVLATQIWDPLWNPFRTKPEKVIQEMSSKMANVKIFHLDSKINLDTKNTSTTETFNTSASFKGDSDVTDAKNSKFSLGFDFDSEGKIQYGNISLGLGGEIRVIGKDSYTKMDKIEIPMEIGAILNMFGIDISKIKGQWIKSTEPEQQSSGADEETMKKIQKLISESKIYSVQKELPDEKIGKIKTYHYIVALNRDEIKKLITEMLKISNKPASDDVLTEVLVGEMEKNLDEFFSKAGDIAVEIWIGKRDKFLYKVKSEKEMDLSKFDETTKGIFSYKVEINLSNFNLPVKIEAPANFKKWEEIFTPPAGLFQPTL